MNGKEYIEITKPLNDRIESLELKLKEAAKELRIQMQNCDCRKIQGNRRDITPACSNCAPTIKLIAEIESSK